MIEKIGQVILDDTNYSGKDLYSDGVIEDEMLEIAENYPEEKWNRKKFLLKKLYGRKVS